MSSVEIIGVRGIGLVTADSDLPQIIAAAIDAQGCKLREGDVVVVAQKVVSKAEGRLVAMADINPDERARDLAATARKDPAAMQVVLDEAGEVMRAVPGVVITRHRTGHVLANSGVDASNSAPGGGSLVLWPVDPDASARKLRDSLITRYGVRVAVIVSDSLGRAWRVGTMGTAIGSAGLRPIWDQRGEVDLFGRVMEATVIGVADEIAAAASLVIGEAAEGVPVAIVRGASYEADDRSGIGEILRPVEQDLFR